MPDPNKKISLKQRAISGVIWSCLQNSGQAVITFVIGLLLARLLMPEDFGLIGMLFIFIAVSGAFVESGFSAALVQKQGTDQLDYSTVFYFNLLVSAVCYGLLFFAAPFISTFYNQPPLTALLRVLALKLVIDAMELVPRTILYKTLAFRQLAIVNGISMSVSGTAAIIAAANGLGVWSLVLQQLSGTLLKIPLLLWLCPWTPSLTFSVARLRPLFSYGSKLLGTSLLEKIFDNVYFLVIGKFYPAAALGYYSRAKQLQQVPTRSLSVSISQVTFPLFSELQDDPKRLKQSVRKSVMLGALVVFPALAGLAAVAEPFVRVVLTEKWMPCVPYVYLMCLVGMQWPMKPINQNVLRATGRSDLFLAIEVVSRILLIVFLCLTIRYGILVMLVGQVAHGWIMWGVLAYTSGRLINYSPWRQFLDIAPIICIAVLMGAAVYALGNVLPSDLLKLALMPIGGAITYVGLALIFRIDIFNQAVQIARNKMGFAT